MDIAPHPIALVVDDEPVVRTYIKSVLERSGFRVLVAQDGLEALSSIRDLGTEVGVVVSDIEMPRLNGLNLMSSVRQEYPTIPFVLVSGYPGDQTVDVLQKPFRPSTLLSAVTRAMAKPKSASA